MAYGCIQVYYGNGKGKTTAALGQCLRIAGHKGKVLVYQFLKNNQSNERRILKAIQEVTLLKGREEVKFSSKLTDEDKLIYQHDYQNAMNEIVTLVKENDYQAVFLDEILTAIHLGYVYERQLIDLIHICKGKIELILTGHYLSDTIKELADYVSFIQKQKHPFDRGIKARKGIEL